MFRNMLVAAMSLLLLGCAAYEKYAGLSPNDPDQAPVMVDHYAAAVLRPGQTWRVYLRAQDPDGDMRFIAATLWQTGFGYYSPVFIRVKDEDRQEFAGYVFLNTPARERLLIDDQFELTLVIRDKQGNRSNSVKFPLRFSHRTQQESMPDQWKNTAIKNLGPIGIDIISSFTYNARGRSYDD